MLDLVALHHDFLARQQAALRTECRAFPEQSEVVEAQEGRSQSKQQKRRQHRQQQAGDGDGKNRRGRCGDFRRRLLHRPLGQILRGVAVVLPQHPQKRQAHQHAGIGEGDAQHVPMVERKQSVGRLRRLGLRIRRPALVLDAPSQGVRERAGHRRQMAFLRRRTGGVETHRHQAEPAVDQRLFDVDALDALELHVQLGLLEDALADAHAAFVQVEAKVPVAQHRGQHAQREDADGGQQGVQRRLLRQRHQHHRRAGQALQVANQGLGDVAQEEQRGKGRTALPGRRARGDLGRWPWLRVDVGHAACCASPNVAVRLRRRPWHPRRLRRRGALDRSRSRAGVRRVRGSSPARAGRRRCLRR